LLFNKGEFKFLIHNDNYKVFIGQYSKKSELEQQKFAYQWKAKNFNKYPFLGGISYLQNEGWVLNKNNGWTRRNKVFDDEFYVPNIYSGEFQIIEPNRRRLVNTGYDFFCACVACHNLLYGSGYVNKSTQLTTCECDLCPNNTGVLDE